MNPLVSVIIPAYNAKRFIQETIDSVLNQEYSNFELIVVDDGSTDGLIDFILSFCQKDGRVRCISLPNNGVSAARNTGFNHSRGSFLAFLDADDVWMPNNLSLKIEKFKQGNFGLVHSDALLIDEKSKNLEGLMAGKEGYLLNDILAWTCTQVPGPSSILVKREVINEIGLFDTNLSTSADNDFFLRVSSRFIIGHVEKATWKYRLHPGNMHKRIPSMEKDVIFVYKKATRKGLFKSYWFKRNCFSNMYLILGASWAGDGRNKIKAIQFLILAFFQSPFFSIKKVLRKWFHR